MNASRLSLAMVRELRDQLGARDLDILSQLAELRLMSGRQIEAVHFPTEQHATPATAARHCRRVLERLVRDQMVVRLPRRVGGLRAGSHAYIYGLGPVGHRLFHDGSRLRVHEPGEYFVDHQLAVSQLVVDLILASRRSRLELLAVAGEPSCWRTVPAIGRAILRPDLFIAIGKGDLEHRWFVEVDRGTHRSPALLRKAALYESYYRSGTEQAAHDVFPRVAWLAPDEERADALKRLFERRTFSDGLMHVTTSKDAPETLVGGPS
jgi:hypothetical protein